MKMMRRTRLSMEQQGNLTWSHGYPNEAVLRSDIASSSEYVATDRGQYVAAVAINRDALDYFCPKSRDEGKLLSILSFTKERLPEQIAIIERLMVDPRFQGHGYGSELISALKGMLPHYLLLAVTHRDLTVGDFYLKNGFRYGGVFESEWDSPDWETARLFYYR
jgi:GNAT superfamily N-acetyltransferase